MLSDFNNICSSGDNLQQDNVNRIFKFLAMKECGTLKYRQLKKSIFAINPVAIFRNCDLEIQKVAKINKTRQIQSATITNPKV